MPIDARGLRDGELAAMVDAEAFRAAVLARCASWHQLPAGTLPNDDAALARLLGYGRDLPTWGRLRAAGALREWVLCRDGRLHCPEMFESVRAAWESKRHRDANRATDAQRLRDWRAKQRQVDGRNGAETDVKPVSKHVSERAETRRRKGKNERNEPNETNENTPHAPRDRGAGAGSLKGFDEFWSHYPRKIARGAARKAWPAAVRAAGGDAGEIIDVLKATAHTFDQREGGRYIPHPATWLRDERFRDALNGDDTGNADEATAGGSDAPTIATKH